MIKKSKLVLADAVVVIDAHENQYWESLCKAYQIALPATIIEDELFYFESKRGKKEVRDIFCEPLSPSPFLYFFFSLSLKED